MKNRDRFLLALNTFHILKASPALALHPAPFEGLGETKQQMQHNKPVNIGCEEEFAHLPLRAMQLIVVGEIRAAGNHQQT